MIPLNKAIGDIPVGQPLPQHGNTFDYSHLLEEKHKQALPGAKIHVRFAPASVAQQSDPDGWLRATLYDQNHEKLGHIDADLFPRDEAGSKMLRIGVAEVRGAPQEHQGQRLYFGRKLYEALMAHAKNSLGATHVGGGAHSSYAMRAHQALAEKHGLGYEPVRNIEGYEDMTDPRAAHFGYGNPYFNTEDWEGPPESFDDRYGPYAYTLKSEVKVPENHRPGMKVPEGGSSCASCRFVSEDGKHCGNKFFQKWNGSDKLPAPADEYCSDWYEPKKGALSKAEDLSQVQGQPVKTDVSRTEAGYTLPRATYYDFSHLLTEEQRQGGYTLEVKDFPTTGEIHSRVHFSEPGTAYENEHGAALVTGMIHPESKALGIHYSKTLKAHRGQHLGRAAYEALIAYAANHKGAEVAQGQEHSTTAEATHRAIAAKYGLDWDVESEPTGEKPNPRGSFDYAHGSYAYRLHRSVTDGELGIPLAKEELDENDPFVQRMKGDRYISSWELSSMMHEAGFEPKHLAYMLRHSNAGNIIQEATESPNFTADVWKSLFNPDGTISPDMLRRVSAIVRQVSIDKQEGSNISPFLKDQPTQFWMDELSKLDKFVANPENKQVISEDAADALSNTRNRFLANDPAAINDENFKGMDHTIGDRQFHETLLRAIAEKYTGAMPDTIKTKILGYAKNLLANYERFKSTGTSRYREVRREVDAVFDTLEKIVGTGIPADALKGVTKKGLYMALLSRAPNFPAKKLKAMIAHFMSPDKKIPGMAAVQQLFVSTLMKSPLITAEEWPNLVKAFGGSIPYEEIVNDPRFTEDLGVHLWNKNGDHTLLESMESANKLTPAFLQNAVRSVLAKDNPAVVKLRMQDELQKARAIAAAAQPPTGYTTSHYNRPPYNIDPQGRVRDRWDDYHTSYQVNPYAFDNASLSYLLSRPKTKIDQATMEAILTRHQQFADYRHPDMPEDVIRPGGIVGVNSYDTLDQQSLPFKMLGKVEESANPTLRRKLTDVLLRYQGIVENEGIESFLKSPELEEGHILRLINEAKNSHIVTHLLNRADAKPEWVDAALARPELTDPEEFSRQQTQQGFSDRYSSLYGQSPNSFRELLYDSIRSSPALSEPQILKFLETAKTTEDVESLARNPKFSQQHLLRVAQMEPTIYSENYQRNPDGSIYRDPVTHMRKLEVLHQGNVEWSQSDQMEMLRRVFQQKAPEDAVWRELLARDYFNPSKNSQEGLARWAMQNEDTPQYVLDEMFRLHNIEGGGSRLSDDSFINHKNGRPEWRDAIINAPGTPNIHTFSNMLGNVKLTPDQVDRMMTRVRNEYGPEANWDDTERPISGRAAGSYPFWAALAQSRNAPEAWVRDIYQKMAEYDRVHGHFFFDVRGARYDNMEATLGGAIQKGIEAHDPDFAYGTLEPRLAVRVGSHPWRGVRDIIEAAGGQALHNELPASLNYENVRTRAPMSDEEYNRIPEKRRPPTRPMKKTNYVSAENVQKLIEGMPATPFNVSHSTYGGAQQHGRGPDQVFQVNLTNDHVKKLKEAGLWDKFQEIQEHLFGVHPVRATTIGWIRHRGVQDPNKTVFISEIQSDLRPQDRSGVSWLGALQNWKHTLETRPGTNAPQMFAKFGATSLQNLHLFPANELDKINEIVWGKKGVDPHMGLLESFHEYLRTRHGPGVTVRLSGKEFAGNLRAMEGNYPGWLVPTYENNPKELGYQINADKYGSGVDPQETSTDRDYKGQPVHTSPVRKYEDVLKSIDSLPELPLIESGPEMVYDANDFLTPEQRKAGYEMTLHTGTGGYGDYSVANIKHYGRMAGGASMSVDDHPQIREGQERKYAQMELADLMDEHTGKGLGMPMYEALLASAKRHWGATHLRGMPHSTLASRVHQKLAEKHGFTYDPVPYYPSVKYGTKEAWERTEPKPYDTRFRDYSYTLKSEEPVSLRAEVPKEEKRGGISMWDYSHMSPNPKYKLTVVHRPGNYHGLGSLLTANLYHIPTGQHVGNVEAFVPSDRAHLNVADALLDRDHRGKDLGRAMYRALYSHALNALGISQVVGGRHSTMAHRMHQRLAAEHGLNYRPSQNQEPWPASGEGHSYDSRYGPYKYTLR